MTDHEKIVMQRKENAFLCDRPGDWLGGGPDPSASHLRHPKSKLRSSWLADEGKSQSLKNLAPKPTPKKITEDRLHASESHFLKPEQDLIALQKKQNQFMTERPSDWLGGCGGTEDSSYPQKPKAIKLKTASDAASTGTTETAEESVEEAAPRKSPKAQETHLYEDGDDLKAIKAINHTGEEKIVLQKKQNQVLCERPGDWLGGCGEVEAPASHPRSNKLRASWIAQNEGMSQSLRDLSLDVTNHEGDPLNASDSHLLLGKKERRKTSPLILAKLSAFNHQNEENHKRNEEFDKSSHHEGKSLMHGESYSNEPNAHLKPPALAGDHGGSLKGQHRKPKISGPHGTDHEELPAHKEYTNTHTKPMRHKALQNHLEPEHVE